VRHTYTQILGFDDDEKKGNCDRGDVVIVIETYRPKIVIPQYV